SLGLTLYELLTGRRAFSGETPAQILAAIIEDDPEPVTTLNPRVPAPVRWVIERCLSKDPRQRYEATVDLARELRTLRERLPQLPLSSTEIRVAQSPRRRFGAFVVPAVTAAVSAALAVLVWGVNPSSGPDLSSYRLTPIATDAGYQGSPAWSPDGKTLAYVADADGVRQLFTRSLSSSMLAQVTHGRFDCRDPFWSPDGARLFYIAPARDRDGLWSISAAGGEPELGLENVRSAAVSPDGKAL